MKNKDCDLCNIGHEEKDWEEDSFFAVVCNVCKVPMIVLKDHKEKIDEFENVEFAELVKKRYPGMKPRKIGMRRILDHWHWHIVKEDSNE